MTARITQDEWLAELARVGVQADADSEGYLTTEEISDRVGKSGDWVRAKLKAAQKLGRLSVRQVARVNLRGQSIITQGYRVEDA